MCATKKRELRERQREHQSSRASAVFVRCVVLRPLLQLLQLPAHAFTGYARAAGRGGSGVGGLFAHGAKLRIFREGDDRGGDAARAISLWMGGAFAVFFCFFFHSRPECVGCNRANEILSITRVSRLDAADLFPDTRDAIDFAINQRARLQYMAGATILFRGSDGFEIRCVSNLREKLLFQTYSASAGWK